MLTRQFRILLQLRSLFEAEENATSDMMAKKLGVHPFVVKKSMSMVRRFTLARLQQIQRDLLDMDFKAKTGRADLAATIDLFIKKQCQTK